jgi:hypothetical protein
MHNSTHTSVTNCLQHVFRDSPWSRSIRMTSFFFLCYPNPNLPLHIQFRPVRADTILFCPILSYLTFSSPIYFYLFLFLLIPFCPVVSCPISTFLIYFVLFIPILPLVLSCSVLSCLIYSYSIPFSTFLFCPIYYCPILPHPISSYPVWYSSVLLYSVLRSAVTCTNFCVCSSSFHSFSHHHAICIVATCFLYVSYLPLP